MSTKQIAHSTGCQIRFAVVSHTGLSAVLCCSLPIHYPPPIQTYLPAGNPFYHFSSLLVSEETEKNASAYE